MVITLTTDDSPERAAEGASDRRLDAAHAQVLRPEPRGNSEIHLLGASGTNDQGHVSRTSFHITPEDRQAPPRHLQARALAKGGPEPSSSVPHYLI
jgi:hypothetical protein